MGSRRRRGVVAPLVAAAAAWIVPAAPADINLVWRVPAGFVRVSDTVEIGLYAVSDNDRDQPFAGLTALLGWDPGALELIGKIDNGPYPWSMSDFWDDSGIDGLNADCGPDVFCSSYTGLPFNDGDARYDALGQFALDPPPIATSDGLLVTTMLFRAVSATSGTQVQFLESAGADSHTIVLGETSVDVTGELGPATLQIADCGTKGDFDGDCGVSLTDFARFGPCLTGPVPAQFGAGCQAADFDGDDDADLSDIAAFQSAFTGP